MLSSLVTTSTGTPARADGTAGRQALAPLGAAQGLTPATTARPEVKAQVPVAAQQPQRPLHATREPGHQQRLGALQQGQAWLDELGTALQTLKTGLGQALARPGADTAGLERTLEQLRQQWAARGAAAGGLLDGQLQTVEQGAAARQRFRLRGLDVQSLAAGGAETLRLSLPGQARPLSVALDGGGLQRQLQQLQRAVAPAGLRLESAGGELLFSVDEAQWPALRDGLGIKGDGKRFPSGQTVRALLEPETAAMAPQGWKIDDPAAQRRTLVAVLAAQQRVQTARQQLLGQLDRLQLDPVEASDQAQRAASMQRLAQDFEVTASAVPLDYGRLAELLPALERLHRGTVQQLLLPVEQQ